MHIIIIRVRKITVIKAKKVGTYKVSNCKYNARRKWSSESEEVAPGELLTVATNMGAPFSPRLPRERLDKQSEESLSQLRSSLTNMSLAWLSWFRTETVLHSADVGTPGFERQQLGQ
jgi:hypothetical protein